MVSFQGIPKRFIPNSQRAVRNEFRPSTVWVSILTDPLVDITWRVVSTSTLGGDGNRTGRELGMSLNEGIPKMGDVPFGSP